MLAILLQKRRDKRAAKKFFRKLLKGVPYIPRVLITDKVKNYAADEREILLGIQHRQHRYLNNRLENSHQPTRQREQHLQRFTTLGYAQRFLSAQGRIKQRFCSRRHRFSVPAYRQPLRERFQIWQEVTTVALAA